LTDRSKEMATDVEQKRLDAGETQALFRDVNERINAARQARSVWVKTTEWVCECADETCAERIEMTAEEYEELRSDPTHFAVAPARSHVVPEAERVVSKNDRYWVVEKIAEAAEVAEELDIR